MRRDSVKLPHLLPHRPMPVMPELAGFEPRYDAISAVPRNAQPTEGLRPLYWWARDLRSRGDILTDVRFDVADKAATVTVRLASYRSVTVVRRTDLAAARPSDLPSLIAEAIWRLGALGWTAELFSIIKLLGQQGLIVTPAPVRQRTDFIPGWLTQPDRGVRMAYWWAQALKRHGWKLYGCGDPIARGGFVAEVPNADGGRDLVIYPGTMPTDHTEASALAKHLSRLDKNQRRLVAELIGDTVTGEGRVS